MVKKTQKQQNKKTNKPPPKPQAPECDTTLVFLVFLEVLVELSPVSQPGPGSHEGLEEGPRVVAPSSSRVSFWFLTPRLAGTSPAEAGRTPACHARSCRAQPRAAGVGCRAPNAPATTDSAAETPSSGVSYGQGCWKATEFQVPAYVTGGASK